MKTMSKLFALALATFMLVGAFVVIAYEGGSDAAVDDEFTADGITYKVLTEAEGETLGTVTIISATPESEEAEITLDTTATRTVIEEEQQSDVTYNVVSISAEAFKGVKCAKVTIPEGIKIESYAFKWTSVKVIDVNSTDIASSAFAYISSEEVIWHGQDIPANCFDTSPNLVTINLDNVKSIGQAAFIKCGKLSIAVDLRGVTVGYKAFNASGITKVELPDDLSTFGGECVAGCASLTDVTWNGTALPAMFFMNCSNLNLDVENVKEFGANCLQNTITDTFPSSPTKIGHHAFKNTKIASVTVDGSKTTVEYSAFEGCKSLTEANLSNMTEIPASLFSGCTSLSTNFDLTSIQTIGEGAFFRAPITGVTLSESLTEIPKNAFFETKITAITIPGSVTTIGEQAFMNSQVKTIVSNGTATVGTDAFPKAGYVYSSGATLTAWSPELTSTLEATTYKATVSGGDPVSFQIGGIDADLIYTVGETFSYEDLTLVLTYDDGSTSTVSSSDEGFAGVSWFSDANCTVEFTPGTTELTTDMQTLYVKYGTYNIDAATLGLTIISATEYDDSKTIEEALASGAVYITSDVAQDVELPAEATLLFDTNVKYTGTISYESENAGSVTFVNAVFAAKTLITTGSVDLRGAIGSGMIIFEGNEVISGYLAIASDVVVVYKSGATITLEEGATFVLSAGSYLQDYGGTVNSSATDAEYLNEATPIDATDFIDSDDNTIIGTDYTESSSFKADIADDFIGTGWQSYVIKWYMIDQDDASHTYSGTWVQSVTETDFEIPVSEEALADRGTYDLYMIVSYNADGTEVKAVSSNFTVRFLDEGYILGLYVDGTAYHAIVKNLQGDVLPGDVKAYAFITKTVTLEEEITYVTISETILTYGIADGHLSDVDYAFSETFGTETVVGLQALYDCTAADDGFKLYSKQILAPGIAPGTETHSAEGSEKAVVYFGTIDEEADDGTVTSTPVIYLYSTVEYEGAQLTLWYNDGSANTFVTLDVDVGANDYLIVEYTEFLDEDGNPLFVNAEGDLDFGDNTVMSAYISVTAEGSTTATTTLEVLYY